MYTIFYVIATKNNETIKKDFTNYSKAREFSQELTEDGYEVHLKKKNVF